MTKQQSPVLAIGPAPPIGPAFSGGPAFSDNPMFSIGKAARRSGVKVETIRFYERSGLVAAPPRTAGGHRVYDADGVRRLAFLRRARELGFTLGEVRELLALADERETSCAEVRRLADGHLAEVRARIADLARMEAVLDDMVARCAGGTVPDCPILEALFDDTPQQAVIK